MESIKEKIPMLIVILIAMGICGLAYYFLEYNEAIYYTQIDNNKVEKLAATDDMKYEYTLTCYNKNGNKKEVKFKTSRELREDAYLMLEVKLMGVHSWEEIEYNNLPYKVQENYSK